MARMPSVYFYSLASGARGLRFDMKRVERLPELLQQALECGQLYSTQHEIADRASDRAIQQHHRSLD